MTLPRDHASLSLAASDQHFPAGRVGVGDAIDAALLARPVLIIEDEVMIAWMLESLLQDMGFGEIRIASTGADAVALARSATPGLILSDINLDSAEMDGVEASSAIAADGDVAVLFITANADAAAQERIRREIPRATLLRKPVDPADLRDAIAAFSPVDQFQ